MQQEDIRHTFVHLRLLMVVAVVLHGDQRYEFPRCGMGKLPGHPSEQRHTCFAGFELKSLNWCMAIDNNDTCHTIWIWTIHRNYILSLLV